MGGRRVCLGLTSDGEKRGEEEAGGGGNNHVEEVFYSGPSVV